MIRTFSHPKVLLCILPFIAYLQSCIKEVDINLPHHEPRLVINALANPDSILRINVRQTVAILDTSKGIIEDASVILFIDNEYYDTLDYMGFNGWYNSYLYPEPNKHYRVEVHHPAMPTASSSFVLPNEFSIISGTFTLGEILNDELGPASTLRVTFTNPSQERNYFELFFSTSPPTSTNIQGFSNYDYFNMTDPSILADGNRDYNPRTIYFSDAQFHGNEDITVTVNLRYAAYTTLSNGTLQPLNDYYVTVRHITEEYYNYLKSHTVHFFNQNYTQHTRDPLTLMFQGDPVPLYTNVDNGYGIVGAYRQTTAQLTLSQ